MESDQSNLESDQSDTTNTGNESNGKTGRTTECKQHLRKENRNRGKPPIEPKRGPPISFDQAELTRVIKKGRRENGRLMSLLK